MDPWDWTINDVVKHLCEESHLWVDWPTARRPDPTHFEQTIRREGIDGATLLNGIDGPVLKEDLGIKVLSERVAVIYALDILRNRSTKYKSHRAPAAKTNLSYIVDNSFGTPDLAPTISKRPDVEREHLSTHLPTNNNPNVRAGEILVENRGRKRRRLQLQLQPQVTLQPSNSGFISSYQKIHPQAYLGPSKVSLNAVFFSAVPDAVEVPSSDEGDDSNSDHISSLPPDNVTRGKSKFISRRISHFLRSTPIATSRSRIIRCPYPERLSSGTRYVSLFTRTNGDVAVSRRDAVLIDHDVMDEVQDSHEWDYLAAKWKPKANDYEYGPLGDSDDDEGIYERSLWSEIEEEEVEKEERKRREQSSVTKDEAIGAVEDYIKLLQEKWNEKKLPSRKKKAWSTWRKARGHRQYYLDNARRNIGHLDSRIEKIKSDMYADQWKSLDQIRAQCASLDVTVFDKLDNLWQIQVWASQMPPPRPVSTPRISKPKRAPRKHNDEESITSESDLDAPEQFEDIDEVHYPSMSLYAQGKSIQQTSNEVPIKPEGAIETSTSRDMSEDSVLGLSEPAPGPTDELAHNVVIDLTISSPADELDVISEDSFSDRLSEDGDDYGNSPETATAEQIHRWKYERLEENNDRKRIVIKLLHSLEPTLRRETEKHFLLSRDVALGDKVQVALGALKRHQQTAKTLKESEARSVFTATKIYVCWDDASHRHFFGQIPELVLRSASKVSSFKDFYRFVKSVVKVHTDSDGEENDPDTPRKKRKKQVLLDQQALEMRRTAQLRRDEGKEREQRLMLQLESSGSAGKGVIINPSKHDNESFIYINKHIGDKLKPHQVEGVRFLWREIVTVGEAAPQGCLLAHTMGLGKTMQTITLLVTVAEAAASPDPKIVEQIPKSLRHSRTLVLCPATLIANWMEELRRWKPGDTQNVGNIFEMSAAIPKVHRLDEIRVWYDMGGVLIIGYDMFRKLLANSSSKTTNKTPWTHEEHELLKKYLLRGPHIVVADEAHKMKNRESGISIYTSQFRTTSRIALTGSPLANNLQDYYAMIDWVAPGYLGDAEEFRHYYQQPIENGTYADSTKAEQRRSLKMLQVLKTDIDPKIHRADISVLQDELKKKSEFLIKLPLTKLQRMAYSTFVQSLLHHTDTDTSAARLMDWLSVLSLLCDHPAIFIAKLRERNKEKSGKRKLLVPELSEFKDDDASGDVNVTRLELSETMLQRQEDIFHEEGGADVEDMKYAHKTAIVKEILAHSKKLGDKVLIFTHWVTTLNYLQKSIAQLKEFSVARLDGMTPIPLRQAMIKDFNSGKYDAFLISTRAGGLGLNITGANRVILMDFSWNPSWEEQGVGRAYRIGQLKPVFVYHLITGGTYEEKLHQITIFKKQLAARVVDKKNPNRAATKVNEMLFEPTEVEQEDLQSFKGMDEVFDSLLESEAGKAIKAVKTTETLHRESDEKLTEEELKEVEEMIKDDRLRKANPDAWRANKLPQRPSSGFLEQMRLINEAKERVYGPQLSAGPAA